jgi:hypothetical protein
MVIDVSLVPKDNWGVWSRLPIWNRWDRPRFERALTARFAAVPGNLHSEREPFYHSVFVTVLQAVGGEIIPESRTDKRPTDAVIKTRGTIYRVEFKLGTAESAQVKSRRHFEPYLANPRPIVLLATRGFAERNIQCPWEDLQE